jgi:hypothetical protein
MFVLVSVLLLLSIECVIGAEIATNTEANALIDMMDALGCSAPGCALAGFHRNDDCNRFAPDALECDDNDHVSNLFIFNDQLSGTLNGAALALLTGLTRLEIAREAGLTGTLPTELNLLVALEELALYANGLSGTLPDLSALTALTDLQLGKNHCFCIFQRL